MITKENVIEVGDPSMSEDVFNNNVFSKRNNKNLDLVESMYRQINDVKVDTIVDAVYVGSDAKMFKFDIGYKDYLYVDKSKAELLFLNNVKLGDNMNVYITSFSNHPFLIKGSVSKLYETSNQHNQNNSEDDAINVLVKEFISSGYNCSMTHNDFTMDVFLPNTLAGINRINNPNELVGKQIDVMIENYSEEKKTYIVSRKKYLQTLVPNEISKLEKHKVYTGKVTGSTNYGLFVEFNQCLTGMIYKSNIAEEYRETLEEIEPETTIEFYVKEISKDKIVLSQYDNESLWDTIKVGDIYEATVQSVKSFGCLVMIDEETRGLISDLSDGPQLVEGDLVDVKVVRINKESRKIILSLQ